ncbi:MAG: ATP synthase subunit I [Candidatus Margulisbacteria bacterium]|nr:ATP synthase subunit I [Candidatus Margulisiibacteriota bacterium]
MTNDIIMLVISIIFGLLLGIFFYGGLWWTVRKMLNSKQSALWFLGGRLLRTGIVLTGFYYVSQGHWQRFLACMLGFILARLLVTRLTGGYDAS